MYKWIKFLLRIPKTTERILDSSRIFYYDGFDKDTQRVIRVSGFRGLVRLRDRVGTYWWDRSGWWIRAAPSAGWERFRSSFLHTNYIGDRFSGMSFCFRSRLSAVHWLGEKNLSLSGLRDSMGELLEPPTFILHCEGKVYHCVHHGWYLR